MIFHRRCGSRVQLSNLNRTARRSVSDFNHGLVLSAEPIQDDVLFEVRIDEKVCHLSNIVTIHGHQFHRLRVNALLFVGASMERQHRNGRHIH